MNTRLVAKRISEGILLKDMNACLEGQTRILTRIVFAIDVLHPPHVEQRVLTEAVLTMYFMKS